MLSMALAALLHEEYRHREYGDKADNAGRDDARDGGLGNGLTVSSSTIR